MYAEVAWVLVSSGTQVQPQVILDPDCLPNYLSVSYDYVCNYLGIFIPDPIFVVLQNFPSND